MAVSRLIVAFKTSEEESAAKEEEEEEEKGSRGNENKRSVVSNTFSACGRAFTRPGHFK